MSVNSRSKGKRGELEVMHILNDKYGYHTRRGSAAIGEPDIVGLPGVHIEVKRREKEQTDEWLEQGDRDRNTKYADHVLSAVFYRKSGKRWKVTMYLEDFMELYGS